MVGSETVIMIKLPWVSIYMIVCIYIVYVGDWIVNPLKFPFGLNGLSKALAALGCKLGIYYYIHIMY